MKKGMIYGAALLVVLGACTIPQESSGGEDEEDVVFLRQIQTASDLKFEDVPVPAGFEYQANESTVFENQAVRTGLLVYKGQEDPQELVSYYRQEMSRFGWSLVNTLEHGEIRMLFEKPSYSCEVTIQPGSRLTRTVTLVILYAPRAQEESMVQ